MISHSNPASERLNFGTKFRKGGLSQTKAMVIPMLYLFFLLLEILLIAAISLPLAIFAPLPVAFVVIITLLLAAVFLRPAKRIAQHRRRMSRRVERRFRPRAVPQGLTLRPADGLSPAEVFRMMELLGVVPADRRATADFTATLLDLNRRGILSLRVTRGDDLLRADGMRIVCRRDLNLKKLAPHEQRLIRLLRRASGPAASIQLSAFADYVSRAPGRCQHDTDAFRRAVDRSLTKKRLLGVMTDNKSTAPRLFRRRIRVVTPRGEQCAALWHAYLRSICTKPYLDSYRPMPGDAQKAFADEAERLLIDAAAAGYCARAAEALMREYLFTPESLWDESRFFSALTETRIAFAGTPTGEAYFFLPLRHFETAVKTAVLHGTAEGKFVGFED